ncbi:hypothetical protein [Prochlorococcus marinus]|uniref:hypothetical protein n=1 Tax=Prochlorococcus marinus TaxID=1219 RepID=UPI0022B5791B|nr:hypothetical protein [Prochlorococcus marinus]
MKDKFLNNGKGFINPENASLIIPILSGLSISLLILIFGIFPEISLINVSRSNIKVLEEKLSYIKPLESRVEKLKKTKYLIKDQENRINKIIVGSISLDTIIVKIEMIANKHNIYIKEIKPSEKKIKSKIDNSKDSLILAGQFTQEFDISIEGIYPDLARFISDLENIESFIIIKEIDLKENLKRSDIIDESNNNITSMNIKVEMHGNSN